MGKVELKPENRVESYESFPKLKLEFNEKARIAILEAPNMIYVHTLRSPKVANGKAVMVTKQRKDKSEYETFDMDFLSRPVCLGEQDVIEERGFDPKNCPACEASKTLSASGSVDAPQRRYGVHVFRYALKGNTSMVAKPFSGQVLVWMFNFKMLNKLIDLVSTWGPLDEHDLELTCKSAQFQQFDLGIQPDAAWSANAKDKETTESYMEENRAKDLEGMMGRSVSASHMQDDIDSILERWHLIEGNAGASNTSRVDVNDLLNTTPTPSTPAPNPTPTSPSPSVPNPGGSMDFDDLLKMASSKE